MTEACKAGMMLMPAMVVAASAMVQAEPVVDVYGHLNYALLHVDDGQNSETFLADNDVSNTRFGFFYEWSRPNGNHLRFHAETALGLQGTSTATMDDNGFDFDYSNSEELRKLELEYFTQSTGTFSFGQGSTATDGVAEADLSGTTVISTSSVGDLAGAFIFQGGDPLADEITVSDAFSNFDGARRFRVRYDAPAYNDIVFSISAGKELLDSDDDREFYDFAATHSEENEKVRFDRRVGLSIADDEKVLIGSLSYLHKPSGMSLAVAGGSNRDEDGDYLYTKFGYETDYFEIGLTAFSVEYYKGWDFAIDGSDSKSWSLAAVQNFDDFNLEIYAAYRNYDFDSSGTNFEDIKVYSIGARWKF